MLSLKLVSDDGQEIAIVSGEVLGRDGLGESFFKSFDKLSRVHAIFFIKSEKWFLEDLASTNGTFLNGARLTAYKPQQVFPNDKVSFSSGLQFTIVMG
jgi:pSer/pThr/pTyr-binding forkhead associated (FHA) protein